MLISVSPNDLGKKIICILYIQLPFQCFQNFLSLQVSRIASFDEVDLQINSWVQWALPHLDCYLFALTFGPRVRWKRFDFLKIGPYLIYWEFVNYYYLYIFKPDSRSILPILYWNCLFRKFSYDTAWFRMSSHKEIVKCISMKSLLIL